MSAAAREEQLEKQTVIDNLSKRIKRSPRYSIQAPLEFRVRGERTWHWGASVNISDAGILFQSETKLNCGDHFEARLILPLPPDPNRKVCITFQAEIVRDAEHGVWGARIHTRRLCRTSRLANQRQRPASAVADPGLQGQAMRGL
jgi:hypothetical protein